MIITILLAPSTFHNRNEFIKLNHLWAILIYKIHYVLYLLSIVDQAQSYERILQLIHSYRAWSIIIQLLETLTKNLQFFILEV